MAAKVLIVDDDQDLRLVLQEFVSLLGGSAVVAASLEEVRSQREEVLSSTLAIVDINLGPNAPTGVAVVAWLRSQGYGGNIVFLTGHGSDDPQVVEAAHITRSRLLEKPLDPSQLALVLDGAARG
jgi:DNA-binding NtrC family response regulator